MAYEVDEKLIDALNSLESAIKQARVSLEKSLGVSPDVIHRLTCYEQVVSKQKLLASQLAENYRRENWDEVRRHGELIRQSSFMIEFDAEAIIAELAGVNIKQDQEFNA